MQNYTKKLLHNFLMAEIIIIGRNRGNFQNNLTINLPGKGHVCITKGKELDLCYFNHDLAKFYQRMKWYRHSIASYKRAI